MNNQNSPDINRIEESNEIKNENIQRKKFINKNCIIKMIISLVIIIVITIFIIFFLIRRQETSSVKEKEFSENEIKIAKYNTVIKLNTIQFPSLKGNNIYKEEHLNSYFNFSYNFFFNLNYKDYSPVSLYNVLINVFMAISDKDMLELLDDILGLNNDERILFYSQIFNNNYFKNSEGEIKISNGAFYNSDKVAENVSYIDQISKTYTECYKLSYKKEFNFIIEWINKSLKEEKNNFMSNLENIENTAILFLSSLYFKQKWATKFLDSNSYKDNFYIDNNNKKEVIFMKHSYQVNDYYDYERYVSFYDIYSNNYLIQYIVPKSLNDSILELINNKNFLYEDEHNKINETSIYISLSVPKFKINNEIDFVPILKNMGFGKLFDGNFSTLNKPFINENNYNYYLDKITQKNLIELNEDGTTIKSYTYSSAMLKSAGPSLGGLEIKLNQPFIYIIRDKYKLPIFIGYVKEP